MAKQTTERTDKRSRASSDIPTLDDIIAYEVDAWQRGLLFLDVMRERSLDAEAQAAKTAPNVLDYKAELVVDGRTLARPVNYALARIIPPADARIDDTKRPFVVVDPRAGHGPGIGGFKADSEIGVAFKAGHPCYFIGFLPAPVPGQTIFDIAYAQARFLETVIARHPEADGKPCVVGNCQAGWAVMILAALRPELFGPIIIAGTPLSYWNGVRGQYPMRYSGGLLGGSWMTALAGDLGHGIFDGALLVQNFENQNPANTLWTKQYNLWSKIDTEAERYLGFEKWWGGHVTLNAEEMQFIVDELFVGNKLAAGEVRTPDGTTVDLRNIRSPIVVFCSKGDNITPPQQALGWILDLYDSAEDIRAQGQTIVYTVHETVGHLGIFVSAGVARKEHDEFASNIDFIEVLPPGLYEAVLTPKGEAVDNPDLVTGEWVIACEARTLDDIRALGGNTPADDRMFEAAARVSAVNLSLYRAFAQPVVQAMVGPSMAEAIRKVNPLRLQYDVFGSANPFMKWVGLAAEQVREDRRPVAPDNPLIKMQQQASRQIVDALEAVRVAMERWSEETFRSIYGAPALQAALGIDPASEHALRKAPKNPLVQAFVAARGADLKARIKEGGLREALIRALLYVGVARGGADERGFAALRQLRKEDPEKPALSLAEFKELVRRQFFTMMVDEEAAVAAIADMLPADEELRRRAFARLAKVLSARGEPEGEAARRLERIRTLFDVSAAPLPFVRPEGARGKSVGQSQRPSARSHRP